MAPHEDRAAFWTRLFRSSSEAEAIAVIEASGANPSHEQAEQLVAWRSHRGDLSAAASRLDTKARELEALQSFGRGLSGARSIDDLLSSSARGIEGLLRVDAVSFAVALPERTGVEVWLARPLVPEEATRLIRHLTNGLIHRDSPVADERYLSSFDRFQGVRPSFCLEDLLIVPVLRRGREVVRIGVLVSDGEIEHDLRVLFGASSHLALHLDRVLAVAEAEQGRFRAILDSMPHAVVLVDAAFQVVQANASAEPLLAHFAAAGGVRSVGDLDLVGLAYEVLSGRHHESAAEATLEDGTVLEVTVTPWQDPAGGRDGLVLVLHDVTTARRLREQVTRSEKLSGLGRLLAGVAHELNNPLTAVVGYAQLVPSMTPGEAMNRRLETMRREAERCRRIVQGLLRFARPHAPGRRAFSLNQAAGDVVQLLAYSARAQGVSLVLDLDPELPAISGDAHEFEQALVNLVSNAQQALAEAARAGTVTLRTRRNVDGGVRLEVEDDGPGIPEPIRAKVFDPFFSTKPTGQGTGLGLWLVYNTVVSHGGRIEVAGSATGGATFRWDIPSAPQGAEILPLRGGEDDVPRVSARILVADPEAALAGLICEALAGEGHEAIAAHDAQDALARLASEPFDLVVSDVLLPGLSAERLAREMARLRPDLQHRLLLTTGDWVGREAEIVARRVGSGLLRKPFEIEELRRAVRRHLAGRPLEAETPES